MKRILLLATITMVAAVLLYLSRFWFLDLWPRAGLFGIQELRPGGGLLGRWLRGTQFAPFELLIWVCGGFLILTMIQNLISRLKPTPPDPDSEDDAHEH